jgi:hypothetical protein
MAFDDGECRVNYSTSSRRGHTGRFVHAIKSVNTESAKAKEWDRRTQGKNALPCLLMPRLRTKGSRASFGAKGQKQTLRCVYLNSEKRSAAIRLLFTIQLGNQTSKCDNVKLRTHEL